MRTEPAVPSREPIGRRALISRTGAAIAGAGIAAILPAGPATATPARDPSQDVGIMQGALAIEHEGIAAYRLAGASGLLRPATLTVARTFMGHHEAHRDALAKLIAHAGGAPVQPKSDADYAKELNLGALKSEADVVALATNLERGAADAYVGQIAGLTDRTLVHVFAQLSTDEAVHWTTLNGAQGRPVPVHAFLFA